MSSRSPSSRELLATLLVGLLALCAACAKSSSNSNAPTLLTGTATVLPGACPSGPGTILNSTCVLLSIEGLGNIPIEVELRIIEPNAALPIAGTVLLGSGSGGMDFYTGGVGGRALAIELLSAGYRIVDRRWTVNWFSTGSSIKKQSARYATLLQWVRDNVHTTGTFNATGNSGGASELAYALTTWNGGDLLDTAVLTSGPPHSRLDYFCDSRASTEWAAICATIVPAGVMQCGTPFCTRGLSQLCPVLPTNPAPDELEEDSILHSAAVLDFPSTDIFVMFGAEDCSSSVPLGLLFFNALTSVETLGFAQNTPHTFTSSPEGRMAIQGAITGAGPVPDSSLTFEGQFLSEIDETGTRRSIFGQLFDSRGGTGSRRVFYYQED